jgi:hypothetical protein
MWLMERVLTVQSQSKAKDKTMEGAMRLVSEVLAGCPGVDGVNLSPISFSFEQFKTAVNGVCLPGVLEYDLCEVCGLVYYDSPLDPTYCHDGSAHCSARTCSKFNVGVFPRMSVWSI